MQLAKGWLQAQRGGLGAASGLIFGVADETLGFRVLETSGVECRLLTSFRVFSWSLGCSCLNSLTWETVCISRPRCLAME